jgi:hypothetical protein
LKSTLPPGMIDKYLEYAEDRIKSSMAVYR